MSGEFLPSILGQSNDSLAHYSYISGLPLVDRNDFGTVVFDPKVDGESKLVLTSTSVVPTLREVVDLIVFKVALRNCGKPVRRPYVLHNKGEGSWEINTPSLPETALTAKGAPLIDLIKRI